jgi:hypothetical protein
MFDPSFPLFVSHYWLLLLACVHLMKLYYFKILCWWCFPNRGLWIFFVWCDNRAMLVFFGVKGDWFSCKLYKFFLSFVVLSGSWNSTDFIAIVLLCCYYWFFFYAFSFSLLFFPKFNLLFVIHHVASVDDLEMIDFFSKWCWILDGWRVIVFYHAVDGDGVCHFRIILYISKSTKIVVSRVIQLVACMCDFKIYFLGIFWPWNLIFLVLSFILSIYFFCFWLVFLMFCKPMLKLLFWLVVVIVCLNGFCR